MKRHELIFNVLQLPVDYLMLMLAGVTTYFLRTRLLDIYRPVQFEFNLPFQRFSLIVLVVSLLFIAAYSLAGLYSRKFTETYLNELFTVVIASSAGLVTIILYIFLRQELFNSRFLVIGFWFFSIFFIALGRYLMRLLQRTLISLKVINIHRVLIIGSDDLTEQLVKAMSEHGAFGYEIVERLRQPEIEAVKKAVSNPGVDEVLLGDPNYPSEKILALVDFCAERHLSFRFIPNIFQALTANVEIETINGIPLIELKRTSLEGWGKVIKRLFDIFFSLVGLILLTPFLIIIAFLIKWGSAGPVFVSLERVSRSKRFKLLKFRSMIRNAEELKPMLVHFNERIDSPFFKMKNDPRVTRFGRFLRKYRLDELPQLLNVLKGEISLVGPRPHQPDEIAKYQKHHRRVLAIKAGVTGMAQAAGSSDLSIEDEVALDMIYIEQWSLFKDITLILRTLLRLIRDKSAI